MKVLHVINSLILAGVEMLVRQMVPRLQELGVDNTVAVLKPLDSPIERELRGLVPFLDLRSTNIYSAGHVRALAPHIGRFDVVHSYLFPSQLFVPLARKLAGSRVPLVTTEQSTRNHRRRWWLRPLDRWMYSQYAHVACNSQATLDGLVEWMPGVRERASLVYNGVPLERFTRATPLPRESLTGRDSGRALAAFVARFDPAKDHTTLLRALARVPQCDLLLVGDGPMRSAMEELARTLGIADRVHFLGRRHDIPQILKTCDFYVHYSVYEGFGIAAVEAMAAGLPVIASDVPGLGEVVKGAGVLVPAGDEERLADAMRSLLGSPARRQELAAASMRRSRDFSIEATAAAFLAIYRSALQAAGRR